MNVTSWSSFDQMFDNTNQPSKKRRKTRKKETSETNSKNKKPKVDLNDLEIQMITDGLKKAAGGKSHKK